MVATNFMDLYRDARANQKIRTDSRRRAEEENSKAINAFLNNLRGTFNDQTIGATDNIRNRVKLLDSAGDMAEYTYRVGDTLDQVIKDIGFESDAGLWGPNGDIAYYMKQLIRQGAFNPQGNISSGTKINFIRRK